MQAIMGAHSFSDYLPSACGAGMGGAGGGADCQTVICTAVLLSTA